MMILLNVELSNKKKKLIIIMNKFNLKIIKKNRKCMALNTCIEIIQKKKKLKRVHIHS